MPIKIFGDILLRTMLNNNEFTEQQQPAMIEINVLVFGFLFCERTIKHLGPLVIKITGKQK